MCATTNSIHEANRVWNSKIKTFFNKRLKLLNLIWHFFVHFRCLYICSNLVVFFSSKFAEINTAYVGNIGNTSLSHFGWINRFNDEKGFFFSSTSDRNVREWVNCLFQTNTYAAFHAGIGVWVKYVGLLWCWAWQMCDDLRMNMVGFIVRTGNSIRKIT